MGGSSAAQAPSGATNTAQNNLQTYVQSQNNPVTQQIMAQYAGGQMSLNQALSALSNAGPSALSSNLANASVPSSNLGGLPTGGVLGGQIAQAAQNLPGASANNAYNSQAAIDSLFTNPETAGLAASSQVMNNPLYSGLFGQSGLQGQAEGNYGNATNNLASDRQALSGNDQSYGLQNSDLAAYGQAADAIGRNTAQQSQGIAQSLAQRGLGNAASGAALSSYAGLYGNQAEQLAGLQQQISQNRINTAMNLAQARNQSDLAQQQGAGQLATSLGGLGSQAYGQQLGSNMNGANNNYNELAGAAGSALNNQIGQQNINNSQWQQQQSSGLGSAIGGLIGTGVGALTGGIGTGIGAQLGTSIGKSIGGTGSAPSTF